MLLYLAKGVIVLFSVWLPKFRPYHGKHRDKSEDLRALVGFMNTICKFGSHTIWFLLSNVIFDKQLS